MRQIQRYRIYKINDKTIIQEFSWARLIIILLSSPIWFPLILIFIKNKSLNLFLLELEEYVWKNKKEISIEGYSKYN